SGRLTNTGEGLGTYHQKGARGHRQGYVLELELGEIPLTSLQSSNFFVIASELRSLKNGTENTNYRIQDFYEGLISAWPGSISHPKDPNLRAPQYGQTCSYKAILKSCKARLSADDRRLLTFFADYEALLLLETNQDSLKQCKEGASRLCRRALKLSKKRLLSPDMVNQLREKTKHYRLSYEKMERERVLLTNSKSLEVEQDKAAIFSIQEPLKGTFWGKEVGEQKEVVAISVEELVVDLEKLANILRTVKSNKQYSLELNLIRQTLQRLPSVDDPFWETEEAKKVLDPLSHILKRLVVDVYGTTEGPLKFSSNSAALLIKGFVIGAKIASSDLPEDLVSFFKVVVKAWYVNGPDFLYHLLSPTDPYLVEEIGKAVDYLDKNSPSNCKNNRSFNVHTTRSGSIYNDIYLRWRIIRENFSTLSDIIDHPQMHYLYRLLKNDPKLKNIQYTGHYHVRDGEDVAKATALFMSSMEYELPTAYTALRRSFYALYLLLTKVDVQKANFCSVQEFNYQTWTDKDNETYLELVPAKENTKRPAAFVGFSFGGDFGTYTDDFLALAKKWSEKKSQNCYLISEKESKETPVSMHPFEKRLFYETGISPSLAAPLIIEYMVRHQKRCRNPVFQSFLWMVLCREGVFIDLCKGSDKRLEYFWSHLIKLENDFAKLGWVNAQIFITRLQGTLLIQLEREKKGEPYYKAWMKTIKARVKGFEIRPGETEYTDGLVSIFANIYPGQTSFFDAFISLVQKCQNERVNIKLPHFEWSKAVVEDISFGRYLLDHLKYTQTAEKKSGLVRLPQGITSHATFSRFLNEEQFATLDEDKCFLLSCKKGVLYKVKFVEGKLRIYREMTFNGKKEWFEYSETLPFHQRELLEKRPLIDGKDTWLSLGANVALLTEHLTGDVCYVVENNQLSPVEKEAVLPLYLQQEKDLPFINRLRNFADRDKILSWSNQEGNLEEIELKEFGFSFLRDKKYSERWNSSLHPGYFLSPYETTSELSPFSHYLLLENEEGERKVLISGFQVTPSKKAHFEGGDPLASRSSSLPQFFVCDLARSGAILPPDEGESLLYLLYLYLIKGDYEKAATLMRHFEALDLEFPEESQIKSWIESNIKKLEITHPTAIPVLLRLDYYLKTNIVDRATYASHINNMQAYPLTEVQENALSIRYGIVSSRTASSVGNTIRTLPLNSNDQETINAMWGQTFSFSSLTRPGAQLLFYFLNCYVIAKEGKGKKAYEDLKAVLQASSQDTTQPYNEQISHILRATIENPDKMPLVSDVVMEFRKDGDKCVKELYEKCKDRTILSKLNSLKNAPPLRQEKAKSRLFATQPEKKIPFAPLNVKIDNKAIIEKIPEEYLKEIRTEQKTIDGDIKKIEELIALYKGEHGLSPSSQHQHERMIKGLEAKLAKLRALQAGVSKQIDPAQVGAFKTWIEGEIKTLEDACVKQKEAIIEMATDYKELELEREGDLLRPLTFEEMKRAFARGDHKPLQKSNPTLTDTDLKTIQEAMCAYLLLETKMQQWERILKPLIKCEKATGVDKEEYAKEATVIAEQKRVYDTTSSYFHTLLVVENTLNLLIRKEQLEAIEALTKDPKNIIIEAGTGFGKTSLVIPIWAYLMQAQGKAPLIVLPKPLLRQMEKLLRKNLGRSVGQIVKTWEVSRGNIKSKEEIQKHYDNYMRWQEKGACILMDDHSYHVIAHLKYRELLLEGESANEKIAYLEKIHDSIFEKGAIFLEESTDVLDPKRRHDFSCGQPLTPPREELNAISALYDFLLFETSVFDRYRLDFYPREGDENRIPITEANYREQMREEIAKAACRKLGVSENPAALKEIQGGSPKDISFRNGWTEAQLKRYSIWRDFIGTYFEQTLSKPAEERYRIGKRRIAIPALRGMPKPTSQFSTMDHIAAFTLQMGMKKPVDNNEIRAFTDTLKLLVLKEEDSTCEKYQKLFEWVLSHLSEGKEILGINEQDISALALKLRTSPRERLKFTQYAVLTRLKTFPYKLSSSSHEAVLLSQHVQGGSGTVVETNPITLKNHENPEAVISNLLEIKKRSQVILSKESDLRKALDAIANDQSRPTVLIDIAGKFLDLTDEEIGETILASRKDLDYFAFYNEGERCIYDKHSKRVFRMGPKQPLPQNTFFFFSQPNVVGQDETFPSRSVAIATASNGLSQDLFFQGSGRMRKLKEGQTVHYFLFENEWNLIPPEDEKIDSLLLHVTSNKGEAQGKELFDSLEAIWRGILFSKLPPRGTFKHRAAMDILKPLWKEETSKDRLAALTQRKGWMGIDEAKEEIKQRLIAKTNPCLPQSISLEGVVQAFDEAVAKMKFPDEVL
ncbi:MAG: DEAD/DEAH box helicase family protein, partial [Chlamydiia bacterium]|nr:DEAD/DEAH box helicase family protein [Chlamydiia bacterium]